MARLVKSTQSDPSLEEAFVQAVTRQDVALFPVIWLKLSLTSISYQAGQCAQVLWRPLALRRLDQSRRSGSWSRALPCLYHPG